jgi:tRNA A37 threonylcarbamoyladenosine dehydratase
MTLSPHVLKCLLRRHDSGVKFGIDIFFSSGVIFISKSDGLLEIKECQYYNYRRRKLGSSDEITINVGLLLIQI